MGLKSITIENFKGIGAPVTVPLRPITLLFGANSAGKSTVIQALQYAWEVLENRNPDVDRTRLGGEAVDLGGFKNLVHQHELDRSISIQLEYAGPLRHGAYLPPEIYWSGMRDELVSHSGEPDVTDWLDVSTMTVRITTAWDGAASKSYISAYEVGFDGVMFARSEAGPGMAPHVLINADHPCFSSDALEGYGEYGGRIMREIRNRFGDPMVELLDMAGVRTDAERVRLVDALNKESEKTPKTAAEPAEAPSAETAYLFKKHFLIKEVIPEWGSFLSIKLVADQDDDDARSLDDEVVWVVSQLFLGAGEAVLEELRGLRYLGPLREVPDRMQKAPLRPDRERWANGMGAWDALLRNVPWDEEGPFLVDRCSEYLHETLGMDYTLRREERIQLPADGEVFSMLRVLAAHFEECEEDDLQRLVDKIEHLESIPVVQLHDEKNDIDVAPMDIGVGISQALPVVVGAVEPGCTLFAVEQPELHIHPAVQSKIGDVLLREVLDPSKAGNRIFLIETHSEHLILRILRRIRESNNGRLPAGFPEVGPGDVQVIYVKQGDEGAELHLLDITPDGDFINDWPDGFFTEREEELF